MSFNLRLKQEAKEDIINAYEYYESLQLNLGIKFIEHLENLLEYIQKNPLHFPIKRQPYHQAILKKFPFIIIYEVENEFIVVYAVFNTWQDPLKKP
tara:strand:+ start:324 stop:611 length:288 start_codon:yes stop_codon:yes gene_type:complete